MVAKAKKILFSGFIRNMGKMISGTGFAHLLGIAVIPVITRLYSPDQIGVFSAYVSLFMICYSVSSLRFEYATLIPKTSHEANNITWLAASASLVSSLIVLLVLLLAGDTVTERMALGSLGRWIYLLPVSIFSYSLLMIMTFSLTREKQYGSIAGGKITASSSTAAGQIILALISLQSYGLVVGKVTGNLLGMLFVVWKRHKVRSSVLAGVTPRRMVAMAKRYRNFPFWNTPHALTTTTSNNIPVLLFNSFFSEAVAGFYAMAVKALYSPVQVVAQAAYQVFSQRIAEKQAHGEKIVPFVRNTALLFAGMGLLPFMLLFIFAPPLFGWFLGSGYETTGQYIRILAPFIYLVFIVTPLNFIPLMLGRQKKAFFIDVVYLSARLAALGTGIWLNSIQAALMLYSVVGVLVNTYLLIWFLVLAKGAEREKGEPRRR